MDFKVDFKRFGTIHVDAFLVIFHYLFLFPRITIGCILTNLQSTTNSFVENYFRKLNNKIFLKNEALHLVIFIGLFLSLLPISSFFNDIHPKFLQPVVGSSSHVNTFLNVEIFGSKTKYDSLSLIGDSDRYIRM